MGAKEEFDKYAELLDKGIQLRAVMCQPHEWENGEKTLVEIKVPLPFKKSLTQLSKNLEIPQEEMESEIFNQFILQGLSKTAQSMTALLTGMPQKELKSLMIDLLTGIPQKEREELLKHLSND